jgi:D,D-heptose 1,7-bisphosphate phosphatase
MQNIDLVILAGGKGTRIKKLTKYSKPIAKFNNLHFLDYLIQNYSTYNFKNIYVLAGFKGSQIKKIYKKRKFNLKKINVIIEKYPMDTGGALFNLRKIIRNNFILTNGDSILDINLKKFTEKKLNNSLIKIALIDKKFTKNKNKLNNLTLKGKNICIDENSKYMNSGVYYCNKNLLKIIKNKKISLENNIIPSLLKDKKVSGEILKNKFFLDIGTPYYFFKSSKILKSLFKRPAVFFDRDNTLIEDKGYTFKTKDLKFKKKVFEAIKFLIKKNYYIFLVTNQAGIAKGHFKEKNFFEFQEAMRSQMEKNETYFHDIEYCPFHPKGIIKKFKKKTELRKPGNMMIKNLEHKWLINKSKSFMIGDSFTDKETAKKSKIYFEYVKDNLLSQVKLINKKLD